MSYFVECCLMTVVIVAVDDDEELLLLTDVDSVNSVALNRVSYHRKEKRNNSALTLM